MTLTHSSQQTSTSLADDWRFSCSSYKSVKNFICTQT